MREEKGGGPTLKSSQGCCRPSCTRCAGKRSAGVPSLVCSEEELGNLTRNTARQGSGRTIRPLLLKALLYAYAPKRRKIKVPVLAGGSEPDRASCRSGEMADGKGVDPFGSKPRAFRPNGITRFFAIDSRAEHSGQRAKSAHVSTLWSIASRSNDFGRG